jgi:hypothetical protein
MRKKVNEPRQLFDWTLKRNTGTSSKAVNDVLAILYR